MRLLRNDPPHGRVWKYGVYRVVGENAIWLVTSLAAPPENSIVDPHEAQIYPCRLTTSFPFSKPPLPTILQSWGLHPVLLCFPDLLLALSSSLAPRPTFEEKIRSRSILHHHMYCLYINAYYKRTRRFSRTSFLYFSYYFSD